MSNSPNLSFEEIYGDQCEEFVCGYWSFEGLSLSGYLTVGTHNLILSKLTGTESVLVGWVLDYPGF